jgi:exodeoxyribonuclease V beta subunit
MSPEQLFAKQPEVLARFLSTPSYIVTLDSFFASILRAASLEIGLEPDFVTKEESDEALERYFLEELEGEGMLNALVRLALDIEDKRFARIFDLMEHFYKVDPLLPDLPEGEGTLTQIEEEVERLRLTMIELLRENGASDRAIKQFETKRIKELFGKKLFEKVSLGEHSWFKKVATPEIEQCYTQLKSTLLVWVKRKEQGVLKALFGVYDHYKNALITHARASGVLTFDDLSYFTYRLLYESISKEFLYFKIDAKFKHILLDEFQDTSTLQFLLLKPLIDEIFAGQGQSQLRSFFYVGDTKQSLYRFRGGVEELFDKVAQRYGVKIEQMDTNYRSSRHVVEQVNRWFTGVMPGFVPQKSREGAQEGYVEVIESDEILQEAVIQAKRLIDSGVDTDEIAFLVSTNKDGQALQEACEKEGIDTLLKTSSSLKHLPKIAALVAMVSYLFGGARIDAEPMLLRVGKRFEEIDLSWFSVFMSPLQVVDRLVREFGYFDHDPNILKLLEFAAAFSEIPTFLEEFAQANIAVASHTVHGAKIMTVHGSKGLEFEHVIVLDRLTRANSDTSPLIFHYNDALFIEKIFYRTSGREHFDGVYAEVMEKRKVSAAKDRMNVLYVALTRAVEGMIILRKPKDSMFDEIALSPMKTGSLQVRSEKLQMKNDGVQTMPTIALTHYGVQEISEHQEDEEKDIQAVLFGTALHYGLEMMGGFEISCLAQTMEAVRNRYGEILGAKALADIESRIRMLIENSCFCQLLEGAKIGKERALSYRGEMKQIDLLLEYETHMLVVDYKSSGKYMQKHRNQVQYYMQAITQLTQKRTEGLIIYLEKEGISCINLN